MSIYLKNAVSVFLIPLILAFLLSFSYIISLLFKNRVETFFLFSGFLFYLFLHFKTNFKASRIYIISHELSHAFMGMLKGNKINRIKIKKNSGYVSFRYKTDFLTTIAPYILPFYALLLIVLYFSLSFITDISKYRLIFITLEGFFIAFHIVNTAYVMSSSLQSDFKKTRAIFFSYTVVFLSNIIFIVILLKLLFPQELSIFIFLKKSFFNFKIIINKAGYFLGYLLQYTK